VVLAVLRAVLKELQVQMATLEMWAHWEPMVDKETKVKKESKVNRESQVNKVHWARKAMEDQ